MKKEVYNQLTRKFDKSEVKSFSHSGKEFRYLEAPSIIKRLNEVLPMMWQWHVKPLSDGCMIGTLSIKDGEQWISMEGVGAPRHGNHINRENIKMDAAALWNLGDKEPKDEGRERIEKLGKMVADLSPVIDAAKAAESDAFKRAARNYGIGLEMWTNVEDKPVTQTFAANNPPALELSQPKPAITSNTTLEVSEDSLTSELNDILGNISE